LKKGSLLHEELWKKLVTLEPDKVADRAKCRYLLNPSRYIITMLNREYQVNPGKNEIFTLKPPSESVPAAFLEQLCLLAYLINAKEAPLADKLLKAESLPGGQFFFRGPHLLPTRKLEEAFGAEPHRLYQAADHLNAKKRDFGDAAVELFVLPRLPLVFVIWAGDEEFSARASILFDQTASEQLPLDALLAAVDLAINAVVSLDVENA
jgi:hypothetical protein